MGGDLACFGRFRRFFGGNWIRTSHYGESLALEIEAFRKGETDAFFLLGIWDVFEVGDGVNDGLMGVLMEELRDAADSGGEAEEWGV